MHIEYNSIKNLNEESSILEEGIKKTTRELKISCKTYEKDKSDTSKINEKESNLKRKILDLNSQHKKS